MAITIKDVALRCNMSISTVSKVFNGYPDISDETREEVLRVAREIGYHPNALARALKTKHSYNLGVLFVDENTSGLTHPFFAAVLNGFKSEAEAHGYDITFINHNIGDTAMTYLEHCRYRNVDGVCLACVDFYTDEVIELMSSDIPCTTIDHEYPGKPCVNSDNRGGIRSLVERAAGLGHRHIAYVHGQRNSDVTAMRIETFRQVLDELGLPFGEDSLVEARYGDNEIVLKCVRAVLERDDRPTCILLPDDASWFGARDAAMALGLRVPDDISFMGFDGIATTQALHPRLTTARQHSDLLGREAARKLIERIENPDQDVGAPVLVPVTMIEGETLGAMRV